MKKEEKEKEKADKKEKEKADKKAKKIKKYYDELKLKVEVCSCVLITKYEDFFIEYCELEKDLEENFRVGKIVIKYQGVCFPRCKRVGTLLYKTFMKYDEEPILCKICPSYTMEDGTVITSKNSLLVKNEEMTKTDGYCSEYYKKLEEHTKKCSSKILTTYKEFFLLSKDVSENRAISINIKMTCLHEETMTCRTFMEYNGPTVCDTCSTLTLSDNSIVMSKKLFGNSITSYNNYIKVFKESECIISTKLEDYMELRKLVDDAEEVNVKYVAQCGHENEIQIKSFLHQNCGRKCYKCIRNISIEDDIVKLPSKTMTELKKDFEEYKLRFLNECDCIITSSFEEFLKSRQEKGFKSQEATVDYIAQCDHVSEITIHSFLYGGCGRKCRECNAFVNKHEDGSSKTVKIEDDAIKFMISILQNKFEIKKNINGCLSDFVIRPKDIVEDKWLMIQQKTTEKKRPDKYKFHINKDYIDCIICCLCLEDKKMWLFDGNDIEVNYGISIGLNTSIHAPNEVNIDNIINKLFDFYNNSVLFKFSDTNIPLSYYTRREQEFRVHREKMCSFLKFEYSDLSGLVYDFTINGKRFQEKVSGDNTFGLIKSNGRNKNQPYKKGDNDYYWLHLIDKKSFIVIPEHVLLSKNGNNLLWEVDLNNSKWSKYILSYNNINKEKFFQICAIY